MKYEVVLVRELRYGDMIVYENSLRKFDSYHDYVYPTDYRPEHEFFSFPGAMLIESGPDDIASTMFVFTYSDLPIIRTV